MIWISTLIFSIAPIIHKLLLANKDLKELNRKILSQKKSGEVVLGQIAESLAPTLDKFTIDLENAKDIHFLGMPIDYIHFAEDSIDFIEIKSGNAQLSTKQRKIKKQIEDGKVTFRVVKIS